MSIWLSKCCSINITLMITDWLTDIRWVYRHFMCSSGNLCRNTIKFVVHFLSFIIDWYSCSCSCCYYMHSTDWLTITAPFLSTESLLCWECPLYVWQVSFDQLLWPTPTPLDQLNEINSSLVHIHLPDKILWFCWACKELRHRCATRRRLATLLIYFFNRPFRNPTINVID